MGDLEAPNPHEQLSESNMLEELGEVLGVLDPRERRIIASRFGLEGEAPKTLEEVGKRFGVTRERIRQLQNGALEKLRRALSRREQPIEYLLPGHSSGRRAKSAGAPSKATQSTASFGSASRTASSGRANGAPSSASASSCEIAWHGGRRSRRHLLQHRSRRRDGEHPDHRGR